LQRLALRKKNHLDEQYLARRSVQDLPRTIAALSDRLSKVSADEATAKAHATDPITIGGRTYPREDIPEILGGKLDGLPKDVRETTRIPIGTYHALRFGIVVNSRFAPEVYLEGAATRQTSLSREDQGSRAVLNALERLTTAYSPDCDRARQDLAIAEAQLRDYQARLGKPFTLEGYQSELTALRDQLKAGLSATAHDPIPAVEPSASELAEPIKAIKARNCVDATAQRVRQKHSSAEEPITARIRRRTETLPDAGPLIESDDTSWAEATQSTSSAQDSSLKSPLRFQERSAVERKRKNPEPTLL
jgi:hypothetical protein